MKRQRRPKPRSPYAATLRRLGHKVVANKKRYTRKGRSQDRPFDVPSIALLPAAPKGLVSRIGCVG